MKTKIKVRFAVILFAIFFLALFFASCGGGGGTGSFSSSSGGSGSVALYIKDAPADDYENIWISIEEVSLISDNASQLPITIFKSNTPDGYVIDLLDLRDQDMLFTIKKDVPARRYDKIRLKIKDIYPVPKPGAVNACDKINMEIKLPSGKIDLNPQGGIDVKTGQTLSIRLDIDADKSIQIHPAGKSGKCIFRPVVFVDIEPVKEQPQSCLRLLKGTIGKILYREEIVIGFILDLPGHRGPLNVYVDNAVIFDKNGLPIPAMELEGKTGSPVSVRGKLDENARFQASLVVLGEVLDLKGIVGGPVDEDLQFPLDVVPGQEVIGEVAVALSDESLILLRCGQPVDPSYIQKDMLARVVGKYDIGQQLFRAIAVFLQPVRVTGKLEAIQTDNGIKTITVRTETGSTVDVIMPPNVPPMLEGDGIISDELFECSIGKDIRVMLDPDKPLVLTAIEVRVEPETIRATVSNVFWYESIIEVKDSQDNELTIYIEPTATILQFNDDPLAEASYTPIPIYEITWGDRITLSVIPACNSAATDYSAFIILDVPPPF